MYQPLDSLEDRPSIVDYAEVDVELDSLDVEAVATQEPHFLDYDSMPPSEFEEQFDRSLKISQHIGEEIKLEKKYERDGEVSDYELAASGYTKKEFTQDDNTLHFTSLTVNNSVELGCNSSSSNAKNSKVKHFLDENPIPPDYLIAQELREHRSLDRNFGRQNEQQKEQRAASQSKASPTSSLNERHISLYSKFTTSGGGSSHALQQRIPRGAAWTDRLEDYSGNMQMSAISNADMDVTLGSKVECVYSLLSMLGSKDPLEMAKKFFELSENSETCITLRRSGCIPLLVQMIHSSDNEENVRKFASMALHNVVHRHPDEKAGRREAKVMRLLDQIMDYCHFLKSLLQSGGEAIADDSDRHPLAAISSLMKVSFDEEHRHAMCELGALQAIPNLVHLDHAVHGPRPEDQCCNSLRRYALMALTNLTFGDENNKALLCSQKLFMEALIAQLDAAPDDLLQVTASVLRNLSWRADNNMKAVLNEIGTVTALARAAMSNKNENTLKAILSALWNLSAHCSTNKAEFCAVDGALAFLVKMLTYEGPSKTLKIIENAGGILRNVSSHIAVCEAYRQVLREHNCLSILLQQLKSESLTVVSNSCGTLWNLSARCPEDQKFLWDNGAIPMLRSLIHSKHAMISEGSSSALKNLLNFRPAIQNQSRMDPIARSLGLKKLPTLNARKQKALQQELGEKEHSETSDILDDIQTPSSNKEQHGPGTSAELLARAYPFVAGIEPLYTPVEKTSKPQEATSSINNERISRSATLAKSESRDSIFSSKSDSEYENIKRSHFATDVNRNTGSTNESHMPIVASTAFELENDAEIIEEQPIDYSVKYKEDSNLVKLLDETNTETGAEVNESYPIYQETDLDQPTDFSLRYAENQAESDIDILPTARPIPHNNKLATTNGKLKQDDGNEMLLVLEDSVKCYQTEDTPYIISNAASITDLRQGVKADVAATVENKPAVEESVLSAKKPQKGAQYGSYTPEKPINYCEEGTPGYFSRYDSLSSLDEASPADKHKTESAIAVKKDFFKFKEESKENEIQKINTLVQPTSNVSSALETPLMFSRRSSMDSLVNEDVGPCDDKSSVVSDFSRLASGIISPSELPDSPTQSMPQTPRRNSVGALLNPQSSVQQRNNVNNNRNVEIRKPLHSVFEDDLSTFNVENTPAQFSTATSLSNLSIVDDEHVLATGGNVSSVKPIPTQNALPQNGISEGEEDESNLNNDDILLASCINIGMNRATEHNNKSIAGDHQTAPVNVDNTNLQQLGDEAKHYCTEDTPALLSKVGSNTNLSLISMDGSRNELKEETVFEIGNSSISNQNRYTRNLSDDVSSNASECGAVGTSSDILQQCILDGMKKPNSVSKTSVADPIGMMRRGGNLLPQYLPVSDEMNKFLVEDSPCNFSVVSGLSNLTVGSSLVGPAVQLKGNLSVDNPEILSSRNYAGKELPTQTSRVTDALTKEDVRREHNFPDDSLSSLSIDSEDDTNLLSQAIAAGCNRPKSNLGFNSATSINKKDNSISSSQPIPIIAASSTSSLTSAISARNYKKQQQLQSKQRGHIGSNLGNNESYSSVDSSDSNDNQSKSLFELCILSGMYKTKDETKDHKAQVRHGIGASSTQSNPNLKQFDSLPMPLTQQKSYTTNHHHHRNHHQRERELKDEKLLLECINTGISKKISGSGADSPGLGSEPIRFSQNNVQPKNVQATSAAVLDQCHPVAPTTLPNVNSTAAAPDVERNTLGNYHSSSYKHINNAPATHVDTISAARNLQATTSAAEKSIFQVRTNENQQNAESNPKMATNIIGFKADDDDSSDMSNQSFLMDTTTNLYVELQHATSAKLTDKQKDPDLMLKSVERLTLEFVTSAEQLRTQVSENVQPIDKRLCAILADETGTSSNNTWNEHTCPNDVSFPSVSVTAPVLASLSVDDEVDDEQATEADCKNLTDLGAGNTVNVQQSVLNNTQPNSLETETDTLVNELTTTESYKSLKAHASNGINFELGGQVQSAAAAAGPNINQLYFNGTSGSIMSNSTMIAFEARALSDNLKQLNDENTDLTFSINSLDLDNVRPPSGMESLNISSCFNDYQSTQPNSIQYSATGKVHLSTKSPKFPRKSLPPGLLARRALGQLAGSAESVNSSYNLLDNIKPPSLMDELLDSMVSVASIQSEVADCENNTSMASTFSLSNYETAAGINTFDDNTITLASCFENMPCDDGEVDDDATFNDFSSAGSTPKKASPSPGASKRTLTPKQKRIMDKDRYRTYTISSPLTLSAEQQKACDEDDSIQIEIIEGSEITSNCFQTLKIIEGVAESQMTNEKNDKINAHIEAKFHDNEPQMLSNLGSTATDSDELDVQQSSETESCNGRDDYKSTQPNVSAENDLNENVESAQKAQVVQPGGASADKNDQQKTAKVVRGRKKTAYISPYSYQHQSSASKVTTRLTSKDQSSPVVAATAATTRKTPITNAKIPSKALKNKKVAEVQPTGSANNGTAARTAPAPRQGTFIKDEPTNVTTQVPVVPMAPTSATTSPSHRASKLPTKRALPISTTSPKRITTSTSRKTPAFTATTSVNATVRKTSVKSTPQRSNTNIRLPSAVVAKQRTPVQTKAISRTTPPSRSNSTLNANNDNLANINQAQNRIANIWKRVGDAKTKQLPRPTSTNVKAQKSASSAKNPNATTEPKSTLIRSSTFDNGPKGGAGKSNLPIVGC